MWQLAVALGAVRIIFSRRFTLPMRGWASANPAIRAYPLSVGWSPATPKAQPCFVQIGPPLMFMIIGTIRLPPENLSPAREVMRRMVDASRAEPGCMRYFYAEDLFDPGLIHITEMWTDQRAIDAHFATSHLQEWRAAWWALGIGDRDLCLFEVTGGRPI